MICLLLDYNSMNFFLISNVKVNIFWTVYSFIFVCLVTNLKSSYTIFGFLNWMHTMWLKTNAFFKFYLIRWLVNNCDNIMLKKFPFNTRFVNMKTTLFPQGNNQYHVMTFLIQYIDIQKYLLEPANYKQLSRNRAFCMS